MPVKYFILGLDKIYANKRRFNPDANKSYDALDVAALAALVMDESSIIVSADVSDDGTTVRRFGLEGSYENGTWTSREQLIENARKTLRPIASFLVFDDSGDSETNGLIQGYQILDWLDLDLTLAD